MSEVKEGEVSAGSEGRRRSLKWIAWVGAAAAVLAVGVVAAVVAGLFAPPRQGARVPSAQASHTAAAVSPSPSKPPLARFDPTAPDGDNLQLFASALTKAAQSTPSGSVTTKTLTDALAASGFDAGSMQRSADQTSANLQAPMLTVSVKLSRACLIGQYVRQDASVSIQLAAPIGTGACLIGETAPLG